MPLRRLARLLALFAVAAALAPDAQAQRVAKYGADFLAGGVGARALGMGGAYVALASDVTAGYWNPSGLSATRYPEAAYMHAERFSGIVQFDYGAVAVPINARSTVGVSFFRSGVDDIPNTLEAWTNGQPDPSKVSFFSAADYAFFVSYARRLRENLSVGATAKVIHRGLGDFANAWGYSVDVGARYRIGRFIVAANVQDVTGMLQSWSIDEAELAPLRDTFDGDL
ncbi:MAG: PorV/PorQ family protein, partial [Rhodothermales bacterium]|nr:PorV/PorQ family protein [Rhodothermales bacterium]